MIGNMLRSLVKASLILGMFLIVAIPWLYASLYFYSKHGSPKTLAGSGLLGDSFGIVNALMSSLAFAGILITIVQQSRQAHEDRQITSRQMFESTFFEMNRIARETKDSITLILSDDHHHRGKEAANKLRDMFAFSMNKNYDKWAQARNPEQLTEQEIAENFSLTMRQVPMFSEFIAFFAVVQAQLSFLESRPRLASKQADADYEKRLLEFVRTNFDSSTLALMLLYGLGDQSITDDIIKHDLARHMNRGEVWRLCKTHYALQNGKLPKRHFRWKASAFEPD